MVGERVMTLKNPATFLERDNWMRALLAAKLLPHATARVALAIAMHLHVESGRCDPRYKTVSKASGVSERSVFRHVELLVRAGWIALDRKTGFSNQHFLLTPANSMAEVTPANSMADLPLPNREGDPCQNEGGPLPIGWQTKSGKAKRTEKRRKTLSPDVASLGGKKGSKRRAREGRIKPEAEPNRDAATAEADPLPAHRPKKEEKLRNSENITKLSADAFPRFWAVYPNHQNEKLARKAFARAEISTDPEAIIAGAQRYALAQQLRLSRPDQTPQHTAHAHNWLDAERWNDPPPPGLVVDEAGHPLAIEQQEEDGEEESFETAYAKFLQRTGGPSW
jgi:hypothetical protein